MDPTFDAARYIIRSRRLADLSQRDLADRLGLSKTLIGRLEAGTAPTPTHLLVRILALAGLRLVVVDAQGDDVQPVPVDVVRDNAGRRFPAHLDVAPPEEVPAFRWQFPRYDRLPARGWYHLRRERDQLREERGVASDHPTVAELSEYSREFRDRRAARARQAALLRRAARPRTDLECICPDECWVSRACLPECPCQCEPASRSIFG